LWPTQCADPPGQGVLQRRIVPISGRAGSLLGELKQGIACRRLRYFATEQGKYNAGLPRSALPIVQRLSERCRQRIMDAPKDAGSRFRLARRAAHDDTRSADLDNLQLRRANVVAVEAASRPLSPSSMQAAVRRAHIGRPRRQTGKR
jgi:hypothetical protein